MTAHHWIVERNHGNGWERVFVGTEALARATYDRHLADMWAGEVRLFHTGDTALVAYARASRKNQAGG